MKFVLPVYNFMDDYIQASKKIILPPPGVVGGALFSRNKGGGGELDQGEGGYPHPPWQGWVSPFAQETVGLNIELSVDAVKWKGGGGYPCRAEGGG